MRHKKKLTSFQKDSNTHLSTIGLLLQFSTLLWPPTILPCLTSLPGPQQYPSLTLDGFVFSSFGTVLCEPLCQSGNQRIVVCPPGTNNCTSIQSHFNLLCPPIVAFAVNFVVFTSSSDLLPRNWPMSSLC